MKEREMMKLHRIPIDKPPFTLNQIKKTIPPHCFNRSFLCSFSYVIRDVVICGLLFCFANYVLIPRHNLDLLSVIAWPLYWISLALFLNGIWMLGHECGHHSFSDYTLLNDIIGFILHSAILIPYFSFKISHRRHHTHNGHLEYDQLFVPKIKSELPWIRRFRLFHKPEVGIIVLLLNLIIGWPLYLFFNYCGGNYKRLASHFDPYSPIYSSAERGQVLLSDVGIITMLYFLYQLGTKYGMWWLVLVYGIPMVVLNIIIVSFAILNHTHSALPHYDSSAWDFLQGSLATVDRDIGMLTIFFHDSTNCHVVHHLFPRIPHYHLKDATKAIVPLLGEYYKYDDTPVVKAFLREMVECVYVEKDDVKSGVFWYNNKFED